MEKERTGPVVLVGGVRTRLNPTTKKFEYLTEDIPNYVVGIVSMWGIPVSGLSVVVSSDYILELIDWAKN